MSNRTLRHSESGKCSYKFECDGPGCDMTYTSGLDFLVCVNKLRTKGWKVIKDKTDTWCHFCPQCVERDNLPFQALGLLESRS